MMPINYNIDLGTFKHLNVSFLHIDHEAFVTGIQIN